MIQKNILTFLKDTDLVQDMFGIAKSLASNFHKVKILPKTFSDYNPVTLLFKKQNHFFKWRLNEILLQKETVKKTVKKKDFFYNNLDKSTDIRMIWNICKTFIPRNSKLKNKTIREKHREFYK